MADGDEMWQRVIGEAVNSGILGRSVGREGARAPEMNTTTYCYFGMANLWSSFSVHTFSYCTKQS